MNVRADDVECIVRGVVKSVLGAELVEAAGDDAQLTQDLGVDSLELAEIVSEVGRRLRLDLSLAALSRHLSALEARGGGRSSSAAAPLAGNAPYGPVTVRALTAYATAAASQVDAARVTRAGLGAAGIPVAI